MAEEIRTVYLVYDDDGIAAANIYGDLGLIDFAKQRIHDKLLGENDFVTDLLEQKSLHELDIDDCIAILEEDGWTVGQNEVRFSA